MALGDVIHGDGDSDYVVTWSGTRGEQPLCKPCAQRATQLYSNGDVDGRPYRRGSGAERLVYRRRQVKRRG